MFLGYSLLQVFDYGIAAIVKPIRKCYYNLTKLITRSEHEFQFTSQSNNDSQDKFKNYVKDFEAIEREKKPIPRLDVYWEGKFKGMEQEMRRMKKELEVMKCKDNITRRFSSPD